MAFYKKKIEKLAAESAAGFLKELQTIEAHAAEVAAMPDAADRFLGYEGVKSQTTVLEKKVSEHHRKAESTRVDALSLPAIMGGVAGVGGLAVLACMTLSPFFIVAVALTPIGILPGDKMAGYLKKRNKKILEGSTEALVASLQALRAHAEEKNQDILKNELVELASSSRCAEVKEFPSAKEAFTAAAIKNMSEELQPMLLKKLNPHK